ncbi:MAG: FHA domain-containing protein [Deltaproteobacteria bacterium]|nr:FHA domain-containing protein [Deltaproteobacteria bacterium]
MKRVTLEVQYADQHSEMKQLEDGTYIIGRDTGDIVLKSTLVSGRHGELKISGSQVVYTDQGSTNGTFTLDGSRLTGPLQMTAGTGLRLGECKIILKAIHVLTSKTVMQPSVKPAFSSTRTVLGQPAMIPPPASVPPAASQPSMAVASTPAPAPQVSQPPAPSMAATEPAPPPYATEPAPPPPVSAPPAAAPPASVPPATAPAANDAPPASAAIVAGSGMPGAGSQGTGASTSVGGAWSYSMDFGPLIQAPMQDKGWIMKCLIIGLITLIPIAGALNMMGWLIAIYKRRKEGIEELPEGNLSYIGDGVKILLAWLPAVGAYVAVSIVLGIITFILPFLWFLSPLVNLALSLGFFAIAPAVMYLCVEKDVKWASMKIADIKAFAQANSSAYIQLLIAFLLAGVISGLGSIVIIGTFITAPLGAAIQAVILSAIKEE